MREKESRPETLWGGSRARKKTIDRREERERDRSKGVRCWVTTRRADNTHIQRQIRGQRSPPPLNFDLASKDAKRFHKVTRPMDMSQ